MITTKFCGIKLKSPIIIASCPATETLNGVKKCHINGAGAVILKSMADYDSTDQIKVPRRVLLNKQGLWATSSFNREVLNKTEGLKLLNESVKYGKIPIIASVAGTSYNIESWVPLCKEVQELGADILQLDMFYLPQPVVEPNNLIKLFGLLASLTKEISIPIIPKLNIEIPAYLAPKLFESADINGISLLDSIRVNSPISLSHNGDIAYDNIYMPGMSSVVGAWQKPITQHYLYILAKHTDYELCAGGGLVNAEDALEMLMLGAKTVQYCAEILKQGYGYIKKLNKDLEKLMSLCNYNSLEEVYGIALKKASTDIQKPMTTYKETFASIIQDKCIRCGRCLENAWCEAIKQKEGVIYIDDTICEGCGFCTFLCKNNSIKMNNKKANDKGEPV